MQPYTPHGDSNSALIAKMMETILGMQPYTPHGDSNTSDFLSE